MNNDELIIKLNNVLKKELKDFQRDTVNRIVKRFDAGQNRLLVSDEVGLGKTLVAKGTIAKLALEKLENNNRKLKVVYICSNLSIADQNLRKLQIIDEGLDPSNNTSRLSKQHLYIYEENKKNRFINLIALTPNTSFNITSGNGTIDERALMYVHVSRLLSSSIGGAEREKLSKMFQDGVKYENWKWYINSYKEKCDSIPEYEEDIQELLIKYLNRESINNTTLMDYIKETLQLRSNTSEFWNNKDKIIRRLRLVFSNISLESLKPDLVIMDEFQRYKFLINSNKNEQTELQLLAERFFKSKSDLKILLLSATPYKMYSTLDEIIETNINGHNIDEHYDEFENVMKFLFNKNKDDNKEWNLFYKSWINYQNCISNSNYGFDEIVKKKVPYENNIYSVMCRTERKKDNDLIKVYTDKKLEVLPNDIKSYLSLRNFIDSNKENINIPIDYVKSCPYLLSFMKDYKIKEYIEKNYKGKLNEQLKKYLWIDRNDIEDYKIIKPNNSRLNYIESIIFNERIDKLLWIPPTIPYYELAGAYQGLENKNISKFLIFSSWEMVPKMLSTLISFEAERRVITGTRKYNKELRRRIKITKPSSMFCLLYPSKFLKSVYNPVKIYNENKDLPIKKVKKIVKDIINKKLLPLRNKLDSIGERYFLIPLLLDDSEYVLNWLDNLSKNETFKNIALLLKDAYHNANLSDNKISESKYNDILDMLANIAIGSPAICLGRTYDTYNKEYNSAYITNIAYQILLKFDDNIGHGVIKYTCKKADFWLQILEYCINGCFQSVIDEYIHLLGTTNIESINYILENSISLRDATYNIDSADNFSNRYNNKKEIPFKIRTNFAVAFANGDNEEKGSSRRQAVRNNFNSPFRPFVLASTSIGQEGLDFHNYCRKIIHWNLPSNPIDLEQREGRIYRYKCLAIRQNLKYDLSLKKIKYNKDIWKEMFDSLEKSNTSDLNTYWGSNINKVKVERILPSYPLSTDESSYIRLMNILNNYRITMGQPKQEELLEDLFNRFNDKQREKLYINLSPYFRKNIN